MDGIQVGELFPKLAKQADKYSLIRSMTHRNNGHETAAYLMQTGHTPGERLAYPSIGAVFALFKSPEYKGLIPPYVVLTQPQGRFSEEGFLGPKYKPFATGGDPNASRFEVEGVVARGITDDRQKNRRDLLDKMDTMGNADGRQPASWRPPRRPGSRPTNLILGAGPRGVRPLQGEAGTARPLRPPHLRPGLPGGAADGRGGRALCRHQLPRRLGHAQKTTSRPCAGSARSWTRAWPCCWQDLNDHGLLESTLVWCCGEFGRAPKIDWQPPWNGGRNHYGNVFTVLVAGGGFKGGHVVGSSDAKAEEVKERPVYPVDLLGSIYQLAGIDANARLPHPMGLEAHVLPTAAERREIGRTVDGDHVKDRAGD